MSARRAACAGALALLAVGLAGCGTDHGQADALAACRLYASANGGGLDPSALAAKFDRAVEYAGKASKASAQWDTLKSSIVQVAAGSTQTSPSAQTKAALVVARTLINSDCVIAARGY